MKNIIILGCGRSGTSILGELFEHLSEFTYFFEPQLSVLSDHISKNPDDLLALKVPKGGKTLTPGLTCDMDELTAIVPEFKLIWIVRNPLDTICSLKPGIEDNWSHNPKPPTYKTLINEPWYIKCAYHWENINKVGYTSAKRYGELQVLKYEDLVSEPENTVLGILNYVDSRTKINEITDYINKISNKVENSYHAKYQVRWFRNDHKSRIDRYKENMSDDQVKESLDIVGETANFFGKGQALNFL